MPGQSALGFQSLASLPITAIAMNEEEIKARIVLPWLRARGISPDDLSLETTFEVRAGRQRLVIGRPTDTDQIVRPRLDVLVRRGSVNLLVIEVKTEDLELTDADRDQAISYARLVTPIAPFALVTNGREDRLFDTITKNPLEAGAVQIETGYTVMLPDEARREALRIFLDTSPANLLHLRPQILIE